MAHLLSCPCLALLQEIDFEGFVDLFTAQHAIAEGKVHERRLPTAADACFLLCLQPISRAGAPPVVAGHAHCNLTLSALAYWYEDRRIRIPAVARCSCAGFFGLFGLSYLEAIENISEAIAAVWQCLVCLHVGPL